VDDFSEQIRESGAVAEILAAGDFFVKCDRYRIEQVVTNLLTNAIKYGNGSAVRISVREEGGRVRLTVRDNGIGIAAENHQRIFERFERAVSASEISGLGLGLYIVKKIVEAHGGDVGVESASGQGAAFTVTLPSAE
jgi:signal transduction histidine kinase